MLRQLIPEQAVDNGFITLLARSVITAALECRHTHRRRGETDERCAKDDDRERHVEKENADEGGRREPDQRLVLERAFADPHHRLDDDRQHRGLEAEEQRRDDRNIAPARVYVAQRHDGDDAGQDEQPACHDAAERAVHQPADVGSQLLRLGPRQQHAIVKRMQEPLFRDPALLLDQDAMHHRDLAGGAAEAQRRDPHPRPERLAQAHAMRGLGLRMRVAEISFTSGLWFGAGPVVRLFFRVAAPAIEGVVKSHRRLELREVVPVHPRIAE